MPLSYRMDTPLLGVWKMTESVDELLEMLVRKADYRSFLERVTAEGRRREHLASRVLLARILGREVRVDYRADGAPMLVGSSLHVSISHTKDYAAVIVGECPVGIDIEYRSDRVRKIRERFLGPDELSAIDPRHEVEQLLVCWCVKEALFKLIGQEGVDFRNHLRILPFTYREVGQLSACETRSGSGKAYHFAYEVTPDYVLAYSLPFPGRDFTATAVQ